MNALLITVIIIMVMTPVIIFTINYREVVLTLATTYGHSISDFHMYMLDRIISRALHRNHYSNIRMIHKLILQNALISFNEDVKFTVAEWNAECLQQAMDEYDMHMALHRSCDYDIRTPNPLTKIERAGSYKK